MSEIKSGFITPDGQVFQTKAEAATHLRAPLIKDAFLKLTGKNADLSQWLLDHQEEIETAFETGTIHRVTKSEGKQLAKALEAIVAANEKAFKFVADNAAAIQASFRWPSVKRMDEAEKNAAIEANLTVVAEGNADLVKFILGNKDAVIACYETGKEKREVPQKTLDALAEARAKRAAAKTTEVKK